MAIKRPGAYVALAANYADDEAIMEAGEYAELLYVRILAFCGRTPKTEGWISDKQIRTRLGLELIPEVGPETAPESRAKRLAEVGLLVREGNGYRVKSWLRWNRSWEEILRTRSQDRDRKNTPTSGKTGNGTGKQTGNASGSRTGIQHSETETETETEENPSASAAAERGGDALSPAKQIEADFAEWYGLYPLKKDKGHALKAYRAARRKKGVTREVLLDALRQQLAELQGRVPEKRPYPGTWLNGERWEDEPARTGYAGQYPGGRAPLPGEIADDGTLLPPLPPKWEDS